ncbi:MAG TPA: isochorismate synthase, partial [Nitrososphaerales archaeon]|nr:isochorismate synthase [Nitrososphaerales archaeon]
VISRGLSLAFREKIKPSRVVRRLISLNPDATVFAIKRRRSVFLGATPESLLSARNGELSVDCIAASSQRSDDAGADEAFGSGLLTDPKSSREHRMVVQAAVSALSPISSRIEVPSAPVLKKLRSIQHLYTPLKATLLHPDDIWVAAQALWPNPAIGGDPRDVATRWISRFENQDRGWYTGVVGVLSANRNDADLVVGIRSGLIRGNAAVVYAGCGIVQGSKPRDELEETRWKLRTMAAALEVEPQEDW